MGVLSDIHIPFEDKKALSLSLDYLKEMDIDELMLMGDIVDFLAISRFNKTLERRASLNEEIEETLSFLDRVRTMFKKIPIYMVRGNHEARWDTYLIEKSPELFGVRGMSLPERLCLKELNITWVERKLIDNDMVFYHGEGRSGKHAGDTVKHWMNHFMSSVIIGHIHKQAVIYQRTGTGKHIVGIENPALCLLDPDYEKSGTCNWQQGGTLIEMNFDKKINVPYPFKIQEGELFPSKT